MPGRDYLRTYVNDECTNDANVDVHTFFHVVVLLPLASSKTVCMRSCLVEPQTPAPDVSQHLLPLKQRQWQRTRHTNEDSPLLLPPTAEALNGCTRTPDTMPEGHSGMRHARSGFLDENSTHRRKQAL